MEVILLQKIANLGNIGDRVKVKPGFGRNYLLPGGKATLATPENVAKFESRRAELEAKAATELASAQQRARGPRGIRAQRSRPRRAARASCSGRSARPTSPRPAPRPVTRSSAPKCACRAGRSAWSASTSFRCTCTATSTSRCRSRSSPKSNAQLPDGAVRSAMVAMIRQDEIRTPPHSVEAEQAVLGGLMLDPNAWDAVADIVAAGGFLPPRPPADLRGDRRGRGDPRLLRRRDDLRAPRAQGPARGDRRARLSRHHRARHALGGERARLRRDHPRALDPAPARVAPAARSRPLRPTAAAAPAHELVDEAERRVFEIAERGSRGRSGFVAVRDILPQTIDRLDLLHQSPGRNPRRPDRIHPARPQDHRLPARRPDRRSRAARRWARRRSR